MTRIALSWVVIIAAMSSPVVFGQSQAAKPSLPLGAADAALYFVPNIAKAHASDYVAATQKVYSAPDMPSRIILSVVPNDR